jgi:hypothetical protein
MLSKLKNSESVMILVVRLVQLTANDMKSVVIDSLRRELLISNKNKPYPFTVFSQHPFKKGQNLPFSPPKTHKQPPRPSHQISM